MPFEYKLFKDSSTGAITESVSQRPDLTRDQGAVHFTRSDVCRTGEYFKYASIGLGHEGAGVVKAIGPLLPVSKCTYSSKN